MARYLSKDGLTYLWRKISDTFIKKTDADAKFVTNISYTNKAIERTLSGVTITVASATTIVQDGGGIRYNETLDSIAEGVNTTKGTLSTSTGIRSHTEGVNARATSWASHAEGSETITSGNSAHAEGSITKAIGNSSHSEGNLTTASGEGSHAEGYMTTASGKYCHAEGNSTTANTADANGASHAEGWRTLSSGLGSHAEGRDTIASGNYSHAEGQGSNAIGQNSHSEGESYATGQGSHAEGTKSTAGDSSHVEGWVSAANTSSHAEGQTVLANNYSHAEGSGTRATGKYSHAEGGANRTTILSVTSATNIVSSSTSTAWTVTFDCTSTISGTPGACRIKWGTGNWDDDYYYTDSVAIADNRCTISISKSLYPNGFFHDTFKGTFQVYSTSNIASGQASHAEGENTTASAKATHAGGIGTTADKEAMTSIGKYNAASASGDLFAIGNGTSSSAKSTAFSVNTDGNVTIKGGIKKQTGASSTKVWDTNGGVIDLSSNITGSGTSGYLTKFNGTNTITNGPQLGNSTTTFLRNDGTWNTPDDTKVTQTAQSSTGFENYRPLIVGASSSSNDAPSFSTTTNYVFSLSKVIVKPSTGDLHLYNTSGDSPKMYFNSGSMTSGASIVYNATTKSLNFEF